MSWTGRFALLGMMCALCVAGCDDDDRVCRSLVPAGRIQGSIRTGSTIEDFVVMVTRVPDDVQGETDFEIVPEADGTFALDVPAGRYTVSLRVQSYRAVYDFRHDGLSYGLLPPDTLRVDEDHVPPTIDFDLGTLSFHVSVSSALEGESVEIELYKRGAADTGPWRSYFRWGVAEVQDGACDVVLRGLLPGEYRAQLFLGRRRYFCDVAYDGERVWWPAGRDSSAAAWIAVAAGEAPALQAATHPSPARLEGRITGAWQELGGSPPDLAIFDTDSLIVMGRRAVASDGSFGVDIHQPGTVKLLVSDGQLEFWVGGAGFADATEFPLEQGRTLGGIEIVQSAMLLELAAPAPDVDYITVRIHDAETLMAVGSWEPGTMPFSRFVIPLVNVRPGQYRLFLESGYAGDVWWRPQWVDRTLDANAATIVTVPHAGAIARVPVVLEAGGAIRGSLQFPPGSERACYMLVTPAEALLCWGQAYAFRSTYEVAGLPEGQWKIGACPMVGEGFRGQVPPAGTIWYPGTNDWEAAGVFVVDGATVFTGVEFPGP